MIKKVLAIVMAIVITLTVIPCSVFASEIKEKTISEKIATEIEKLYEERAKLALDFDNNADRITAIDKRISQLGAKTVSQDKVDSKIHSEIKNGASINAQIPSAYGDIQWTSYRTKTNVAGTVYELEIFTGTPSSPNSVLMKTVLNYSQTPKATYKAAGEFVFSLACAGISSNPDYAPIVSLVTIAKSALGLATVPSYVTVSGVNCALFTAITTTMKYVFVKYDGSPDSAQILMYQGNSSVCNAGFNIGYNKKNADGSYSAEVAQFLKTFSVKSTGYDDYYKLCSNYHNYKAYGRDFEYFWLVTNCTISYNYKNDGNNTQIKNWRVSLPVDY